MVIITQNYYNMIIEELRKIEVLSTQSCESYNTQKVIFDVMYFNRLEIIKRPSDKEKFIVIEENKIEKFYIIVPFNKNKPLIKGDLVTYNTILL